MLSRASRSITGPTSVARRSGFPVDELAHCALEHVQHARSRFPPAGKVRAAPSIAARRESNADCSTSCTTCSGSADESTIITFWPPVSAISGIWRTLSLPVPMRWDSVRAITRATSVDPVNNTPRVRGSATSAAPTVSPFPGRSCTTSSGTPARCSSRTASAAISGVCSAGLASTGFPAASAALTCR